MHRPGAPCRPSPFVTPATAGLRSLLAGLLLVAGACNKSTASTTPEPATDEASEAEVNADASAPEEQSAAEASPAMIATYQSMANDVYGRDAEHCLEDEMENEGSRYMRAAYQMTLTIDTAGLTTDVTVDEIGVQVRNYEGEVLKDGDGDSMGRCLVEAAKGWEFEPAPPQSTTFTVSGSLGD